MWPWLWLGTLRPPQLALRPAAPAPLRRCALSPPCAEIGHKVEKTLKTPGVKSLKHLYAHSAVQ